jgi:hypothetical protein
MLPGDASPVVARFEPESSMLQRLVLVLSLAILAISVPMASTDFSSSIQSAAGSAGRDEQQAIQLTKDAHTLTPQETVPTGGDPSTLRNDYQIQQRLSTLKGTLRITGWSAKRIDDQTFLVTYGFEQDSRPLMFSFETNIAANIVRNVIDDPILRLKYGVPEPPEVRRLDGKWRDLDGTLMPLWKPPNACELKSNGDSITIACDRPEGSDRTVANGRLSRSGDRLTGRVTISNWVAASSVTAVCEVTTEVSLSLSADGNRLNGRIVVVSMNPTNSYLCSLLGRTSPADQPLTLHRDR